MSAVELDTNLQPIAELVMAKSNGAYDEAFVRRLVADAASEFADAPVQDYVQVLIAKEVTDELRRLNALTRIAN